jgi:hypothetical protein
VLRAEAPRRGEGGQGQALASRGLSMDIAEDSALLTHWRGFLSLPGPHG